MSTLYPGGDYPVTPNLGLALWDMSFEMAENMILIDTAVGSGSSVQINGSVIANPNFNNTTPAAPGGTTPVLWQVSGSSVSGYVNVTATPPGGSSGDIQYNNSGVFGGSAATIDAAGNISALSMYLTGAVKDNLASTGLVNQVLGAGAGGQLLWTDFNPNSFGTLFLDSAASPTGIAGYLTLTGTYPSTAESTSSVTASGGVTTLIKAFATAPLGLTAVPMGQWTPSIYASVDSLTQGPSLQIDLYNRTSGGTETLITTLTVAFTNTATTLYTPTVELGNVAFNATDLLVAKFSLVPGGASSRTAVVYYDGTTHVSHVHIPVSSINKIVFWSGLSSAVADLTLANAGFNTTFNQTSATNWTWANTTAATGSVSQSSPVLNINGTYWNGSASVVDSWALQNVVANGTNGASTLTFTHSGTTGVSGVQIPKIGIGTAPTANPVEILLPAVGSTSYFKITGTGATFSTRLGSTFYSNQYDWFTNIVYNGSTFSHDDSTLSAWRMHHLVATSDGASEFGLDHWSAGSNTTTFPFSVLGTGAVKTPSNGVYAFGSANNATFSQVVDTGISRISANVVGVGNGTTGDFTGALKLGAITEDNATAATSGTSQSSPIYTLSGRYWDGAASQTDSWTMQDIIANGTNGQSTLTFTHSGSTGISVVSAPLFQAGIGSTTAASYSFAGHPTWGLWAAGGGIAPTLTAGGASGQGVGVIATAVLFGVQGGWFNLSVPTIQIPTQATPISIKPNLAVGYGTGDAGNTIDIGFSRTNANNLAFGTTGVIGDTSGSLSFTNIVGSVIITQTTTPAAPTVTVNFGTGASTWGYKVVAKDSFGSSIGGAEGTVSNNATLSNATAGNKITVTPVAGAKTYDIYRTTVATSPATTGKIATLTLTSALANNNYIAYDVGALTISAAANASGGNTVYTASMTNYAPQQMVGSIFVIAGFVNGANNGTFTCVAQTGASLTLNNSAGIAETHAATATQTGDGNTVPAANTTGTLKLTAGLMDSTASLGTSGKVLSSTGTATQWIAQSALSTNASKIQGVAVAADAATPAPLDTLQYIPANTDWESSTSLRMQGAAWSFGTTAIGGAYGFVFATLGGSTLGFQSTTAVGVVAAGNLPPMTNCSPNSSLAGSSGGFNVGNLAGNPVLGNIRRFKWAIRLTQTASMRIWIGLGTSSGMAPATYRSDTPAAAIVGFRYSTSAADTKYMCVAQTDNTHQSITAESTATHVDSTTLHVFEIQYDGTSVYYLIDNVLVGTQTTNLPTVVLAPFVFIDNVGATGAPAFDYAYMLIEGRQ